MSDDATRLFEQLAAIIPRPPKTTDVRPLSQLIGDIEAMKDGADEIARALTMHLKEPPETVAVLHRAVRIVEDFALGMHHAVTDLKAAQIAR